jgi:hypothetical protein
MVEVRSKDVRSWLTVDGTWRWREGCNKTLDGVALR